MQRFRVEPMADKEKEIPKIPSIEELQIELAREQLKHGFRKSLWNIAVVLIVAAAITALIATRLLVLIRIDGPSMEPTLASGEVVILYQTGKVKAGDVIGFYYGGRILLKRVIASGGDLIEIDGEGNVYVDGEKIDEPYLENKSMGKCEVNFPYRVPQGMYFVLGDNRAVSIDSRIRSIGCVEENQIVGRTVFRAWPLDRMEIMH